MSVDAELVAEVGDGLSGEIPGWFADTDRDLFAWFLGDEQASGDIVELGAYLGRSAVHMGRFVRAGERLVVCDLFDDAGTEMSMTAGAREFYRSLSRRQFEANYLSRHDTLPTIVQAPTAAILEHVEPASCRFIHIDAAHSYDAVRGDLAAARVMLCPDGIVAVDDYRSAHTPGTAAAVWEAVVRHGLLPLCLSADKFYGTWTDPTNLADRLRAAWRQRRDGYAIDEQPILGRSVIRVVERRLTAIGTTGSPPYPPARPGR